MMRPKRVVLTLVTPATNSVALTQTPGAAGNLTLAGALAVGGVIPDLGLGYILNFTVVGDQTGKSVLITGFDQDNKAQTETLTLGNGAAVVTLKFWRQVTTIAVSAALTGAITAGTAQTTLSAASPTYCLDLYESSYSFGVDIGGTINYDLKKCFERPTAGETPNWVAGGLATQTADGSTSYAAPTGAVRLQINSYSSGATIAMSILTGRFF